MLEVRVWSLGFTGFQFVLPYLYIYEGAIGLRKRHVSAGWLTDNDLPEQAVQMPAAKLHIVQVHACLSCLVGENKQQFLYAKLAAVDVACNASEDQPS